MARNQFSAAESPVDTLERLLSKVDKNGPVPAHAPELGPCWIYSGQPAKGGYCSISVNGREDYTHRLSYKLHGGVLLPGQHTDHLCREKRCCNPAHLEAVTPRENILRGEGVAALNAKKTHCKRGHEFTSENTTTTPKGGRSCRECNRQRCKKYAHANRKKATK